MPDADDPTAKARRLAAESLAGGDATGWFDRLYSDAELGRANVPWDHREANPILVEWFAMDGRRGDGAATALVIGSGLGDDAELVAAQGFRTTAFDISPTAVRAAQARHQRSPVDYRVANLLDPPPEWNGGFDLVVESMTVQALPRSLRERATAGVQGFVADGGTLVVIAFARTDEDADDTGPPWPLTRDEVEAFASDRLRPRGIELALREDGTEFWRARFHATAMA
jgi:hypothetical protein